MSRQLPAGVVSVRNWCYGELEFDALMRQLDNAVSLSHSFSPFCELELELELEMSGSSMCCVESEFSCASVL